MPLQTKFALSFVFLIALLIVAFLFHVDFILQQAFYDQALRSIQSIASASGGAYSTFIRVLKTRTIDWGSDGYIRGTLERLLAAPKEKRGAIAEELAQYLRTRKLPYDTSISAVDFFDLKGNSLVSSDPLRSSAVAEPEAAFIASHDGKFGHADVGLLVSGAHDDGLDVHVVTRMFALQTDAMGAPRPMDAVLMLHFKNIGELSAIFSGELGRHEGLLGGKVLDGRPSAEVYLVGPDGAIVTSSHSFANIALRVAANTAPVAACQERGEAFGGLYINHFGVEVVGATVCARSDNTVIIAEAAARDVFAPYRLFRIQVILAGIFVILLGFLGSSVLSRQLLRDLARIIDDTAAAVKSGFKIRHGKKYFGELAGLSVSINRVLDEASRSREELREANAGLATRVKERTDELEQLRANLEREVNVRTKEVREKLKELEQFRSLFVERELKMVELKKEIVQLETQLKNKKKA